MEVHRVKSTYGYPCPERVDREEEDEGTITVYYPIEGEDYYFAVYMDPYPEVSVRWVGTTPGVRVYLTVESKSLELETLIRMVGVRPNETWRKGQVRKNNIVNGASGFTFEPNPEKADELEHKIDKLLRNLRIPDDNLAILAEHAETEVVIAYYGYKEQMWGWNISRASIQKLAKLNFSVDLDLYAGGPDLPE